jgi:hypothetical protein
VRSTTRSPDRRAEDVFPERALKQIAAALPRHNHESLRLARDFETAVGRSPTGVPCATYSARASPESEQLIFNWGIPAARPHRRMGPTPGRTDPGPQARHARPRPHAPPAATRTNSTNACRACSARGPATGTTSCRQRTLTLPAASVPAPRDSRDCQPPQAARAFGSTERSLGRRCWPRCWPAWPPRFVSVTRELASEADALAACYPLQQPNRPSAEILRERLDRLRAGPRLGCRRPARPARSAPARAPPDPRKHQRTRRRRPLAARPDRPDG